MSNYGKDSLDRRTRDLPTALTAVRLLEPSPSLSELIQYPACTQQTVASNDCGILTISNIVNLMQTGSISTSETIVRCTILRSIFNQIQTCYTSGFEAHLHEALINMQNILGGQRSLCTDRKNKHGSQITRCRNCQQHEIHCDLTTPQCSHCRDLGIQCS